MFLSNLRQFWALATSPQQNQQSHFWKQCGNSSTAQQTANTDVSNTYTSDASQQILDTRSALELCIYDNIKDGSWFLLVGKLSGFCICCTSCVFRQPWTRNPWPCWTKVPNKGQSFFFFFFFSFLHGFRYLVFGYQLIAITDPIPASF